MKISFISLVFPNYVIFIESNMKTFSKLLSFCESFLLIKYRNLYSWLKIYALHKSIYLNKLIEFRDINSTDAEQPILLINNNNNKPIS